MFRRKYNRNMNKITVETGLRPVSTLIIPAIFVF